MFGAKFGISAGFCAIYVSHTSIFPVMFAASSFGFCNILARSVTIASPVIAQIEHPIPMICFSMTCIVAGVLASFLRVDDPIKERDAEKKWAEEN